MQMSMHPAAYPNHNRFAMTAPRPRLHRLLSDDDSSSASSIDIAKGFDEQLINRNLFAQPPVVQNDIFRSVAVAHNYHDKHQIYQKPKSSQNPPSQNSSMTSHRMALDLKKTPRKTRARGTNTCSKIKRTGNDQFCGLSAQISQEIAYRSTPMKTPMKTPGKTANRKAMAPLSQDLFQAKAANNKIQLVPMTDTKLIRLTKTESMSTSSDGRSSPRDLSLLMAQPPQLPAATPKKGGEQLPINTPKTNKTQTKKKMRKTPFLGLSARKKLKKCLTPPRKNFGSHLRQSISKNSQAASMTLSTSYNGVDDYRLTSTEHDPAPFQVELPSKNEIAVHSKVCALMDGYTAIHRDFNFAMLSGISHTTLQKEIERSSDEKPMIAGTCHRDVVSKLLDCADDIVVEGFFREYTNKTDERESERMEACILSSERLRQIVVCFRGSTANQAKPLAKSNFLFAAKQASSILHKEQPVPVLKTFQSAYFGTPLEKTVFALLANLATRKPFFDVVMTGHSFGAAMATIASLRYASLNSQMRVSCHVFGSLRIGGEEWRQRVHSVPNLRIYRVENGADPYVSLPSGNEWIQCGHAIRISDDAAFEARRFDRDRPSSAGGVLSNNMLGFVQAKVGMAQGSSSQGKVDHEIASYGEKLTSSGDSWFTDFCEMKGSGIRANNERRMLA